MAHSLTSFPVSGFARYLCTIFSAATFVKHIFGWGSIAVVHREKGVFTVLRAKKNSFSPNKTPGQFLKAIEARQTIPMSSGIWSLAASLTYRIYKAIHVHAVINGMTA
jgi:hypothetical protein